MTKMTWSIVAFLSEGDVNIKGMIEGDGAGAGGCIGAGIGVAAANAIAQRSNKRRPLNALHMKITLISDG
jgi:hypothetical protein